MCARDDQDCERSILQTPSRPVRAPAVPRTSLSKTRQCERRSISERPVAYTLQCVRRTPAVTPTDNRSAPGFTPKASLDPDLPATRTNFTQIAAWQACSESVDRWAVYRGSEKKNEEEVLVACCRWEKSEIRILDSYCCRCELEAHAR